MSLPNEMIASMLKPSSGSIYSYIINQSCRFNDNDSAYLSRTFPGAGNRRTWTLSCWVKFGNLNTAYPTVLAADSNHYIALSSTANTNYIRWRGGTLTLETNQVLRDPSAWYHLLFVADTTQATAEDRAKIYINGVQVTSFRTSTYWAQNYDGNINSAANHFIGQYGAGAGLFDGYMAEVAFIDGQQLDPTSFGEFSTTAGVWIPKDVSGLTFGTNGFHLDFADSADLGNDVSGNNNDFTPSGLAAVDIMPDTPTNNFCTLNPVWIEGYVLSSTLSNGNLGWTLSSAGYSGPSGTFAMRSGKWYWEVRVASTSNLISYGLANSDFDWLGNNIAGGSTGSWAVAGDGTFREQSGTVTSDYGTTSSGDIAQFAFDADSGDLWVGFNNSYYGGTSTSWTTFDAGDPSSTGLPADWYLPLIRGGNSTTCHFNFGADDTFGGLETTAGNSDSNGYGAFQYAPPTGFLTLCTSNFSPSIAKPSAYFDIATYTGNGTAIGSGGNEISSLSFQPDFVWIKNRDAVDQHVLTDAVRGATKYISSDGTDVEATDAETLATFDADGFTVGSDVQVNTNTENYVAWCWKAGGSGSSDTNGSISSTVSKNTTAGFSIVKYTGSGANATVGHGLGAAPGLIIVKNLDQLDSWAVYHSGVAADPQTDYLVLDTGAFATDDNTLWNDTAPTGTVFSVGTHHSVNASGERYVAYCFTEVEGFSRFGTYNGNGNADGPFNWCGFRPKFVLIKSAADNHAPGWNIFDSERTTTNPAATALFADDTHADTAADDVDLLSNGFKLRDTGLGVNRSGYRHIFAAFAEHPFAYANAR